MTQLEQRARHHFETTKKAQKEAKAKAKEHARAQNRAERSARPSTAEDQIVSRPSTPAPTAPLVQRTESAAVKSVKTILSQNLSAIAQFRKATSETYSPGSPSAPNSFLSSPPDIPSVLQRTPSSDAEKDAIVMEIQRTRSAATAPPFILGRNSSLKHLKALNGVTRPHDILVPPPPLTPNKGRNKEQSYIMVESPPSTAVPSNRPSLESQRQLQPDSN